MSKAAEDRGGTAPEPEGSATVVYLRPSMELARIVGSTENEWSVRAGTGELTATLDDAMDPELAREAMEQGTPVVVEHTSGAPVIVGTLATQRSLKIDQTGAVEATVRRVSLHAREGVQLRTNRSFIELGPERVELYAKRVVTRARDVAKTLAALIQLN